ncbi:MAG: NUDIX hydrolase [Ahniella sp.]|nr:NUDIX hydrolase [Ahniella sp.]
MHGIPAAVGLDPEIVAEFRDFARSSAECCLRSHLVGHFTGSAFVVSADGRRTLLTHHRKLDRWLQPGGHADGDGDLQRVALKEAEEETGLEGLQVGVEVFDLDRHWIPERKSDPGHWHYDVRFVVRATGDESFVVGEESNDLRWWPIQAVAAEESFDPSLRRMATKWLAGV